MATVAHESSPVTSESLTVAGTLDGDATLHVSSNPSITDVTVEQVAAESN